MPMIKIKSIQNNKSASYCVKKINFIRSALSILLRIAKDFILPNCDTVRTILYVLWQGRVASVLIKQKQNEERKRKTDEDEDEETNKNKKTSTTNREECGGE